MGRLTITVLFSKNTKREPSAILQCDTSGEYFPYNFVSWKDGVHYLLWSESTQKDPRSDETFSSWQDEFGYSDEEEFTGDYNQFNGEDLSSVWLSPCFSVSPSHNIKELSIWTMEINEDENDGEDDDNCEDDDNDKDEDEDEDEYDVEDEDEDIEIEIEIKVL